MYMDVGCVMCMHAHSVLFEQRTKNEHAFKYQWFNNNYIYRIKFNAFHNFYHFIFSHLHSASTLNRVQLTDIYWIPALVNRTQVVKEHLLENQLI